MGSDAPPVIRELTELLNQYQTALERDPQDPQLLVDMANVLFKLDRAEEALRALRMAGWLYFNRGQGVEAVSTGGRIMRFYPEDTEAHQLVEEVRAAQLLEPDQIDAAIQRGRSRRVSDDQPVVVLSRDLDQLQPDWDQTAEHELPPEPVHPWDTSPPPATGTEVTASDVELRAEDPDLELPDPDEGPTHPMGRPDLPIGVELLAAAERRTFFAGATILDEADPCSELYVVERGHVVMSKLSSLGTRVTLTVLPPGEFFGELGILGDGRAHAAFVAREECSVAILNAGQVRQVLGSKAAAGLLRRRYRDGLQWMLQQLSPVFRSLPADEAELVLQSCRPVRKLDGQAVVRQGDPGAGLHFVLLGNVLVTEASSPGAPPVVLGELTDGAFFGEMSLLYQQPAMATVTARGFCQLLLLPASECSRLLTPWPGVLEVLGAEARRRAQDNEAIREGRARFEHGQVVPVSDDEG
jgi:CRP-like cAMP-binding protein